MTLGATARVEQLRDDLLAWGRLSLRDTPWRRTRDPWLVLVSETMLQQTQVDRVLPRYERFVARFPDPRSCADAPAGEVIALWHGLGYNRRAVALHRTAGIVVRDHGGRVPVALDDLLALPGVGPYTARAVRVFAHAQRDAVVDVNVVRVLRRAVAGDALTPAATQALADELVDGLDADDVWTWNQSVMELGARHCRKRAPRCDGCPVSASCAWRGVGPDPAAGSSLTQPPFEGSDRQGRGRIVDALRDGPVPLGSLAAVTGWDDPDRVARVAGTLVGDRLAVEEGGVLRLPDGRGR